jgi:RNA polymerase sigma-70 factor, ECF subfamily
VREASAEAKVRLESMFSAHYDGVWRALRRSGLDASHADDAAQEVFVIAARRIADIRPGSERAFLLGTALRVASDVRRARGRSRSVADEDAVEHAQDPAPSIDELADQKRARELLDDLLARMPEDLAPVFVLFEIEALPTAEIAEALALPSGTVASRLRRAREWFEAEVDRVRARSETKTRLTAPWIRSPAPSGAEGR